MEFVEFFGCVERDIRADRLLRYKTLGKRRRDEWVVYRECVAASRGEVGHKDRKDGGERRTKGVRGKYESTRR